MYRKVMLSILGAALATAATADTADMAPSARESANLNALQAYYPKRALAAREQGSVGFRVKIDASGEPSECQITKSSGYPLLDKETCDLITLRAVFKRPNGLSGSQLSTHDGVVNWKLPDSMTIVNQGAPKPVAAANMPEKKICKKVPVTGSLVRTERVCMSASQWRSASDESKEMYQGVGSRGSTNGGN